MLTLPKVRTCASTLALAAALLASTAAGGRTISIAFTPASFSNPLDINNTYFPLVPGTTYTYEADTGGGCEVTVTTVTNDTRVIDGVTTRVVHDVVYDGDTCDGQLQKTEDTLDYYAQDNSGNVWYMGEDTSTCTPTGCTPAEGAWIGGVNGAMPGIIMLAQPRSGDSYYQEYLAGHAEDQALVTSVGITGKLRRPDAYAPGTFQNCIVTKEWSALEKGSIEFKTYCPNIGMILTVEHHGKAIRTELTSVTGGANALKFRTVPGH